MINAFSPDYVKTYMPEFLSTLRKESDQKLHGEKLGAKSRVTRESVFGTSVDTITYFPKTKRVSLAPTEFLVYSRAGTKNTKAKK